jgi:hypothetical protein
MNVQIKSAVFPIAEFALLAFCQLSKPSRQCIK